MSDQTFDIDFPNNAALRRRLLAWYRRTARDLPWRRLAHDPFAVWLSEMMLQQTQVATVIPYFERFLSRYPTVQDLAAADRDDVLTHWAGLGYYRRAHHLHDAAQCVVSEHDGEFPRDAATLQTLPGIGRYTAGAIASIAFGAREAVLDGNVKRVLARLTASAAPPDSPAETRRLWSLAEVLLPRRDCGTFNQALMELGATVCTPRQPDCSKCPLKPHCAALRSNSVDTIPVAKRRAFVRELKLLCIAVTAGDGKYVLVHRRPTDQLWGGTWSPPIREPNGTSIRNQGEQMLPPTIARRIARFRRIGEVEHQLTHRRVTIALHRAESERIRLPRDYRWLPIASAAELPTAFRKVIALL